MSGYGGNLTYPTTKFFWNGDISASLTDYIANVTDAIAGSSAASDNVLFFPGNGGYMINKGGAEYSENAHVDAVAKVVSVYLDNRAPCDDCNAELGFIVNGVNKDPGVMNMNYYGFRRTYSHKFIKLDAITAGLISDEDLLEAYADICQQITQDNGRGGNNLYGNTESTVDCVLEVTLSAVLGAATFDIPAAGIYGAAWAAPVTDVAHAGGTPLTVGNYLSGGNTGAATVTTVASDDVTNGATQLGTITTRSGFGYVVHPDAAQTVETGDTKLILTTKDEYDEFMTFHIEDLDGTFTIDTAGNYEGLPWAEVFREFSHMAHDVPLSNHHYIQKPDNAHDWHRFILFNTMGGAAIHGASHGDNYMDAVVFYVQDTGTMVADVQTVLDAWIAATV